MLKSVWPEICNGHKKIISFYALCESAYEHNIIYI